SRSTRHNLSGTGPGDADRRFDVRSTEQSPRVSHDDDVDHDVDDAFRGMLEGIRTTLPGSQVLLAFLLTVPLQAGFGELDGLERTAFLVALLGAAVASVLLIAPTAHARVRFPSSGLRRRTMGHLRVAAWLALAGTVALAAAIGAAVFLSVALLLGPTWAGWLGGGVAVVTIVTWFAIPVWWTLRGE
ncbi:MAG: DUF6328 family protein, partial [Acidimicrobiia bacterium]